MYMENITNKGTFISSKKERGIGFKINNNIHAIWSNSKCHKQNNAKNQTTDGKLYLKYI